MKIDAIGVTSKNIKETAKFYNLLGFHFPEFKQDEKHLEPTTHPGEVRLMIDDRDLIKSITGKEPVPPTHSTFAILCESPAEVDLTTQHIKDAGYTVIKAPWDAFWGQRYAIVQDPDGYMVDIFANLKNK
jgi:uncharacterized glyoxalase superfamily protein PhnB